LDHLRERFAVAGALFRKSEHLAHPAVDPGLHLVLDLEVDAL